MKRSISFNALYLFVGRRRRRTIPCLLYLSTNQILAYIYKYIYIQTLRHRGETNMYSLFIEKRIETSGIERWAGRRSFPAWNVRGPCDILSSLHLLWKREIRGYCVRPFTFLFPFPFFPLPMRSLYPGGKALSGDIKALDKNRC